MGYGPDLLPDEALGMAFLLVLYLVDRKLENRIAMQYIKPIQKILIPRKSSSY